MDEVYRKVTPERLFAFLGLFFSLVFIFVTPPFQAPDEHYHFFKSYYLSDGNLFARKEQDQVGGLLPSSLTHFFSRVSQGIPYHPEVKQDPADIFARFGEPLNRQEVEFTDFRNAVLYSPVPYLPQALGISVGKIFGSPPIVLFYLGRLFNALTWFSLTLLAIRITPLFKWVFLALALLPMVVFIAASTSADAPTIALAFLLIALILECAFVDSDFISDRKILLILAVSILLALSKQSYFFLSGLFFIVPVRKLGSWKRYLLVGTGLVLVPFMASAGWSYLVRGLYVTNCGENCLGEMGPGRQMRFILRHPLAYLRVLIASVPYQFRFVMATFIGVLGFLDTKLPGYLYVLSGSSLLLLALTDHTAKIRMSTTVRVLTGLVFLACVVIVETSAYIGWNAIGWHRIEGIQGRYFIPMSPLAFLLLYNNRVGSGDGRLKMLAVLAAALVLVNTVFVLIRRYYIP